MMKPEIGQLQSSFPCEYNGFGLFNADLYPSFCGPLQCITSLYIWGALSDTIIFIINDNHGLTMKMMVFGSVPYIQVSDVLHYKPISIIIYYVETLWYYNNEW